jgi:Uma2 family endonuclease
VPVSEKTFEQLVLEDDDARWELVCGRLREKPGMTMEHNSLASRLVALLHPRLPLDAFEVRSNAAHLSRPESTYLIPDVSVIPTAFLTKQRGTMELETYSEPLPFVAEVWSPSTGEYDIDTKLPEYRARGDLEIWRLHPYEKTLIAWRRQADGSYRESRYGAEATVVLESLPNVVIELGALFA